MNNNAYLLISGCTGVGKTTLANILSVNFNANLFSDPFEENPYIEDAYNDFVKWTFHSQLFFLVSFAKLHARIDEEFKKIIIQERSIYECYNIFVKFFYATGSINKRDLNLYKEIYNQLIKSISRKPDLVLYLKASPHTILNRISTRNRDFEKTISLDFIKQQDELYEEWMANEHELKMIRIDTEKLNFINNENDLKKIIDAINAKIR